jgi:hypothetical protein
MTDPQVPVTQKELGDVVTLRQEVEERKLALKYAEEALDAAELLLVYAIDRGRPIEPGRFAARIAEIMRTTPKWKEAFAAACGPKAVERVIAATMPSVTRKLVVVDTTVTKA